MSPITRGVLVCSLLLIGLHTWAAVTPSHSNWGYHYFAFFPTPFSVAVLSLALLFFVPRVRVVALSALGAVATTVGRLRPIQIFGLLLAGWIGLMLFFPVRLHLLGDSELILTLTPRLPSIDDASANFRNQPLTHLALRGIQWVMGMGGSVEPLDLYRVADGIAGIVYLALVFHFLRVQKICGIEAILLGAILLIRVGTQFFFGYVENYMFFYTALTAYVVTGWLALEGRSPLWLPIGLLALLPGFHLAGVAFLPTGLLLALPWLRERRRLVPAAAAGAAGLAALAVFVLGPSWLLTRIGDALRNDFLPLTTPPNGSPYGMFSAAHLVDWGNAYLHIVPLSVASIGLGLAFLPRREYASSPVFRFLVTTTAAGAVMTFVILPGLGMARDWDMLTVFFSPMRFLTVWFLIVFLRQKGMRHAVLVLAVISALRLAGWIGLNADAERHLARAVVLTEPSLSGTFPKIHYENLGKTFFERREYASAAAWYSRYVAVDSSNPRILGNLSDCYRALGERDLRFDALRRAVAAKSSDPGVYSNLAVECLSRGDTARALGLLDSSLAFEPANPIAHANIALITLDRGEYARAKRHSQEAIRLGFTDPAIFRIAKHADDGLRRNGGPPAGAEDEPVSARATAEPHH